MLYSQWRKRYAVKNQKYELRRNRAKWNLIKVLYVMSAEKRETLQILSNCKFWKEKADKPAINQAGNWIHCLLAEVSQDEATCSKALGGQNKRNEF